MTPDGISQREWGRIHALAGRIANAISAQDDALEFQSKSQLFRALDRLEKRYGALPSILATRADYISDSKRSVDLLRNAFAHARRAGDARNMTFIASSLAERYWEMKSQRLAATWVRCLGDCLRVHFDRDEDRLHKTLRRKLNSLPNRQAAQRPTRRRAD